MFQVTSELVIQKFHPQPIDILKMIANRPIPKFYSNDFNHKSWSPSKVIVLLKYSNLVKRNVICSLVNCLHKRTS